MIFLPVCCFAGQSSEAKVVIFHWTLCLCRQAASKMLPDGDSRVRRGTRAREKGRKYLTSVLDTFQGRASGTPLPWMRINYQTLCRDKKHYLLPALSVGRWGLSGQPPAASTCSCEEKLSEQSGMRLAPSPVFFGGIPHTATHLFSREDLEVTWERARSTYQPCQFSEMLL